MKKFFILWSSQAASIFGSAVVGFALAWYMAKETGSATILATALMLTLIPQVVLGPFIGPFIDRWNRKKIMIFSDLATMLLTLVLIILFYTNSVQIWHIYLVMVGRAISGTFQAPAVNASIPMIVPEKHLARAAGLNQALQGAINIISPTAGAFLMEALPMQAVLLVDTVTAIIAIGILLTISISQPPRTTLSVKVNYIGDMVQGFRYMWSKRGVTYLTILAAFLLLFSIPAASLLPILVKDYLDGDVLKLGWISTAFGVGSVLGGIILGIWGGFKKRILITFMGEAIVGISMVAIRFTSAQLFFIPIIANLFIGIGNSFIIGPIMAILNKVIARDMQGRVFSLIGSLNSIMMPLGLAIAGPLADSIGIRSIYLISGIAFLIATFAAMFNRTIMNMENQPAEEKPAVAPSPKG
jgi:DHA3 family macrolide efflux protein-like MFS transporter